MTGTRPDQSTEVEARLLRTLYDLSASAGRMLDPAELVKLVADHAGRLLQGDAVALFLWDDAAGALSPVFTNDPRQTLDDRPLHAGEGAAGQAIQHRQIVCVDDYEHYPHASPWGLARQLKAVEAAPLLVGGRPIGALVVRFYTERRTCGDAEHRTLGLLAAQVAPALEAARLYAASTIDRQHERALREITQALAANLDERNVLDLAVQRGAELLRAGYARVWLIEPNGELTCAAGAGYIHADTFKRRLAHDSTSGRVARQQIVNLANAPTEQSWHFNREFGERTGLGAYLGAGLWRAGQSLGVLEFMRQTGDRFNQVEEQLLLSLANAVAVAVSNARALAAVERLAHEAQQRAHAVAQSERVLRSVYAAIGSGVLVFDDSGTIVNANAAAAEILGRPVESLVGMRSADFNPGISEDGSSIDLDDRPGPMAARTRQPVRKMVFQITRPDGSRRWLQADAVPVFSAEGKLTRVISSFIDISEMKRSAEALRHRDAILEAVAFAAEQLLTAAEWEPGIDDVLRHLGTAAGVSRVYIVAATEAELGFSAASHHEWTADGIAPRADPLLIGSYLESVGLPGWEPVLRDGSIIKGRLDSFTAHERKMLAAQGVRSIVVVPIFSGPSWWGFIGFDDCSEERDWPASAVEVLKAAAGTLGAAISRRRAEAERLQLVREQAARVEAEAAQHRMAFLADASQLLAASLDYENTLRAVAHLVVPDFADCCLVDIRDADGTIRRLASAASPAYAQGWDGPPDMRIDPASDHPVAVVLRTGQPNLAPALPKPFSDASGFDSGLIVPLLTRSGPAGAITWLVGTPRPAYSSSDVSLAKDLARRCALAVDNSRLYQEARAAVTIRDEFLSVAAHELKTPLTSLRGYAQLLEREFDKGRVANPERARRAAVTIQVQSDKLTQLITQLLDISRIQSGKLAIDRRPSDLGELVGAIVESTRARLKDHVLVAQLPDRVPLLFDPLRIEQVLTNLLDNAIKYSPEGGLIEVGIVDRGETVEISVRDRGVGVPTEHRPHIFDRFYQAHAGGPLTSMAGMGLGLYISRQIVELHDGLIQAEFPEDGGTRLMVTLPRV